MSDGSQFVQGHLNVVRLAQEVVALTNPAHQTADVENRLGPRIKRARVLSEMSQEAVAGKLGVSLRTFGTWEREGRVPLDRVADLASIFGEHWNAPSATVDQSPSSDDVPDDAPAALTSAPEVPPSEMITIVRGGLRVTISPAQVGEDVTPAEILERMDALAEIASRRLRELGQADQ